MRLAVFHFNCIEYYPPLMNFIRCLPDHLHDSDRVVVCSTMPDNKALFESPDSRIIFRRPSPFTLRLNAPKRVLSYLRYNLGALFIALRFRPDVILYYETISAWVPFVLKRFFFRRVPLFIHYHEYMSPAEYAGGMFLNRYFHRLEQQMYPRATQISHTNEYRMKLFQQDEGIADSKQLQIQPNYPPESWQADVAFPSTQEGIGILYVGSLNFKDFYLASFIDWVEKQNGKVYFDIYCQVDDFRLSEYLKENNIRFTKMKGSAAYDQLPKIIRSYQVGVILYKSESENTVYSAPNKLFEYSICGLDVWLPENLKGAFEYLTKNTYPKILAVNFDDIASWDLEHMIARNDLSNRPNIYTCQKVYANFIRKIMINSNSVHLE